MRGRGGEEKGIEDSFGALVLVRKTFLSGSFRLPPSPILKSLWFSGLPLRM